MIKNAIKIPFLAVTLFALTLPAAAGQWLHILVEEEGSQETVRVNFPLTLAKLVAPMIEEHSDGDLSQIEINDRRLTVQELREIWERVKAEGDYRLASVQHGENDIVVALEGPFLIVRSREGSRHQVDVQVPTPIVDALLSGTSDQLNISAALDALSTYASDDFTLVNVVDGHDRAKVKVWISQNSDQ
ncbi:MAG TPA: hypothetical protein VLV83_15015 [Acidobacteriota bacterium]|nr:hypothetical protein [Acidobacteriota bacterium]